MIWRMSQSFYTSTPENPAPQPETITVHTTRIACDGGAGASQGSLGHPLVYLTVGADSTAECPYCDRRFVLAAGADAHGH